VGVGPHWVDTQLSHEVPSDMNVWQQVAHTLHVLAGLHSFFWLHFCCTQASQGAPSRMNVWQQVAHTLHVLAGLHSLVDATLCSATALLAAAWAVIKTTRQQYICMIARK
jgi:hypothetical protein